jgi:hypothetical protein
MGIDLAAAICSSMANDLARRLGFGSIGGLAPPLIFRVDRFFPDRFVL